jgi:CheY-like chemotaxis protein
MSVMDQPDKKVAVLVVDDDPEARLIARRIFERMNYQVFEAEDGQRAVAMLQQELPPLDLVFLDFVMPGMDGIETLMKLREIQPGLVGILCSGFPRDVCYESNTVQYLDFLSKPYSMNEFRNVIGKVLEAAPSEPAKKVIYSIL